MDLKTLDIANETFKQIARNEDYLRIIKILLDHEKVGRVQISDANYARYDIPDDMRDQILNMLLVDLKIKTKNLKSKLEEL